MQECETFSFHGEKKGFRAFQKKTDLLKNFPYSELIAHCRYFSDTIVAGTATHSGVS